MIPNAVQIEGLTKMFPSPNGLGQFTVIDSLNLEIGRGTFAGIVGPSGCGKTTLLNIIAGIESYNAGEIAIVPQEGVKSPPRIGYVFQSPRLLNWLTVEDNIRFALEAQGIERARWNGLVKSYLDMAGLAGRGAN